MAYVPNGVRKGMIKFDYVTKKVDAIKLKNSDPSAAVFHGFTGGKVYFTPSGQRVVAVESSWSCNILKSLEEDDVDFATYAMKSSIVDLNDVVIGGYGGSPYSIGDWGFYTDEQFSEQANLIAKLDRENAVKRRMYFSQEEWKRIDRELSSLTHFTKHSFIKVRRGDSFCILALRKLAFKVAILLLKAGIDPMRENEDGKDCFHIVKEAYSILTSTLKDIIVREADFFRDAGTRSNAEALRFEYIKLIEKFEMLTLFTHELWLNYLQREEDIEKDISYVRRCELLNEVPPPDKLWNVSRMEKLTQYLGGVKEIIQFTEERTKVIRGYFDIFRGKLATQEEAGLIQTEDDDEAESVGGDSVSQSLVEKASQNSSQSSLKSKGPVNFSKKSHGTKAIFTKSSKNKDSVTFYK